MKRFKNRKLATAIIAFTMVFVIAGGFAALTRTITLNGRVNVFAPQVEIIWADADVTSYPDEWAPDNRRGIGWNVTVARFAGRSWPAPLGFAGPRGQFVSYGTVDDALATWQTAHTGGGGIEAGAFPTETQIAEGTVANTVPFRTLDITMVFDNFDQAYTWVFTLGNPGDVDLLTESINVATPLDGVAEAILTNGDDLQALFAPLVGLPVPAGQTVEVPITFTAPAANWLAWFAAEPVDAAAFLDGHFNNSVEVNFSIELISVLP